MWDAAWNTRASFDSIYANPTPTHDRPSGASIPAGGVSHTPEPWLVRYGKRSQTCYIVINWGDDGDELADVEGQGYVTDKANAHRIVQCVNACASIANPKAEFERLRKELSESKELLDYKRECETAMRNEWDEKDDECDRMQEQRDNYKTSTTAVSKRNTELLRRIEIQRQEIQRLHAEIEAAR